MSVSERTREIGTLMSIGYHRRHIMTLFIAESSMIATGGAVIGLIMGVIVIAILNLHGIPFLIPGTTDILTLRPFNSLFFSFLVLVLSFSAGILGSIFPAIHASRLSPMEAMVHI
jgi:putative ABC transport system permease protein